jgi:hypothetical protein
VEDPSFQPEQDAATAPIAAAAEPPAPEVPEFAIQTAEQRASGLKVVVSRCPHCGGADLVRAVKMSQPAEAGSIGLEYRTLLVIVATETLYADLCKACGTVVRLYVRETDRNWVTG